MIAQVTGTLLHRAIDRVEIMTAGGIAYECLIPLSVYESLPEQGKSISLHTHLSVREDAWQLFAFGSQFERAVFQRLLVAKGVGPSLALGILSALSAERVVRSVREKDVPTLMRVPRVGRKKAEQIVLDLADKMDVVGGPDGNAGPRGTNAAADDAIRALMSLGYSQTDADRAVKGAIENGASGDVSVIVRAALARLSG